MLHRHLVLPLCLGLLFLAPLRAQSSAAPSAETLLEQGLSQAEHGELEAALQTLLRVDPSTLATAEQRIQLQQAIVEINRRAELTRDPADMMRTAEEAESAGDLDRAMALYRAVLKSTQATDRDRLTAQTKLAMVRRRHTERLTAARTLIDQAEGDIKAGRYADAQRKLHEVQGGQVDLGWFDNERVERHLALVQERLAQQPASQPGAAPPGPAALASMAQTVVEAPPDSPDLLAQVRQMHIQEKLAQARAAEQQGQYALAARRYQEVLAIDPNNEAARSGLTAAQAKSDVQLTPTGPLSQELEARAVQRQAINAEFRELMNRARALYEARNFTGAREAVSNARVLIDRNQRVLPGTQYNELREEAARLLARVDEGQRLFEEQQRRDIEIARQSDAARTRAMALRDMDQQVQQLLDRARDLRREQNYDRALELVNQALFLDPNNFAAQAMKEMIEDSRIYVETRKIRRQRDLMIREGYVETERATLPYTDLMTFPADWPELTARRLAASDEAAGELEINRRVELKLREPVPVNFENNTLFNVIEYLRNTTGLNFHVNWTALQNAGIDRDYPISLQLANVPAGQALELVLQEASAINELDPIAFAIHEGIVKISTDRQLKQTTVTTRIHDIRDLLVQVPNFDDAPEFDLSSALSAGGTGSGGGGGSTASIFGDTGTDTTRDEQETLRQERVFQILDLIQTIGRPEEWVNFGGDISSVTELNGNLIVRTTPQNHREIGMLLAQLRETRAIQINVEARFLLVDQNFLEEVGVDVDMQIGDGGPGDKWRPIKIVQDSFNVANRANTGITGTFGQSLGSTNLQDFIIGEPSGTGRSLDMAFSYLDDIQVAVLIRASQASRRAMTLTAPRLTFFNGQQAWLAVARQVSFVSDLEPVPDAQGFNPTLSVTQSGVVMSVEGTVSNDRRYVTMTILPALATIIDIRSVTFLSDEGVSDNNNNNNNNNRIISGTIEAPELEITQLRTTVSVPDKGTLLLGGQRLMGEIEIEAGVPVLSKIPLLNRLFTNRSLTKDERTLLILIKPTIIIQTEEEELNFPGLQQSPHEFNIGRQYR